MQPKKKNNEMLSRREFFKTAVQKTLPFMAALSLPSFILSCGGDDPINTPEGCTDCTNSCLDSCSKVCSESCENGNNSTSCTDCGAGCENTCSGECANNCETGCSETCSAECKDEAKGNVNGELMYAVDLGLSVFWATFNLGATKPEEIGEFTGWGDVTGKKTTSDLTQYPNANPPQNISGTEFDIARYQWGDNWRLPSVDECRELNSMCTKEEYILNGVKGYKITGANGNSIFLPKSSVRLENRLEFKDETIIWTGEKMADIYAYGFHSSRGTVVGHYRYTLIPVRPVIDTNIGCLDCSSGCVASCRSTCSGNCEGGCETSCSTSCTSGCKNTCGNKCSAYCSSSCTASCGTNCEGGCENTCYGGCSTGCENSCEGGCFAGCTGGCTYGCGTGCTAVAG